MCAQEIGHSTMLLGTVVALASAALMGCSAPASSPESPGPATAPRHDAPAADIGGQEEFGPYDVVANWPQPLPDGPDGVKHEGWTWGSSGAVYAETPDRIWIAMRGELPLPPAAKPWTPYGMLNPTRGNATGNDDGLGATCEPQRAKRGWERRYHHVSSSVDRDGKQVQYWPQHDKLFAGAVWSRTAQDQDEPVRSRQARLGDRRPAARDLQVHL